ncbi:MAG: DUF3604 domain-containing protein, partial [Candidatus Latescibacteria bacterium]|nr:DUF3604 domain-containing protein [Candidatus Latescibacterota bacterium]
MRKGIRLSEDRRGHADKDPSVAMGADGTLWVAWHSYRMKADRILLRGCRGRKRGELLEISDREGVNFQPRVACDGEGTVWVVWSAMRRGRWCILARSVSRGRMGRVIRLDEGPDGLAFPAITADAQGRLWAAWSALSGKTRRIVGRCLRGGKWSDTAVLSSGPGEHLRPVLCSAAEGVWLAYQTLREGQYDLFLRRWVPSGPGRPMRFSLTDSWELFPRLCGDGGDGLWATWIVTHDVTNARGFVDHKVEAMASHFDGTRWTPYRGPDRSKPDGYVTHLYDGLLGRSSYMGFVGWRRRPQIVRESGGDVWLLYERKEEESMNRHGPDSLLYARPLTGSGRSRSYLIDNTRHAHTVSGDIPVSGGRLPFAGQVTDGRCYADIVAGYLPLDRSRPVRERPASEWKDWVPLRLPAATASAPRPSMRVGGKTYRLYWGDLHCHGNLSGDAEGEIDENYAYGRQKSRLDFMAVADNDVIYDNVLTPSEWALIREEAAHHTDPGRFVAFSAYERTYRPGDVKRRDLGTPTVGGPKGGQNHRIVIFPEDEGPLYHFTEPDADTQEKWVARIQKTKGFTFPHHGTWQAIPNTRLGGVEVCSCWDIYMHISNTVPEHLRAGYRLAFMGNSDSHRIVPGMGGALTGVWAESLTRDAILEALWAKRCFATNGDRSTVDVRIKGSPMGSEASVQGPVTVDCRLRAQRVIQSIDLFRDGEIVLSRKVGRKAATLSLTDSPPSGEHFYHVQVSLRPPRRAPMKGRCGNLQVACGDFAWSSPIWVET